MTTDEKLDLILYELVSIKAKVSNIKVTIENDVKLLNLVVAKHSEMLERIS